MNAISRVWKRHRLLCQPAVEDSEKALRALGHDGVTDRRSLGPDAAKYPSFHPHPQGNPSPGTDGEVTLSGA